MDIEVIYDPDHLPVRKKLKVRNATAAYNHLQNLMELKRPRGMRLRYSYDVPTNMIHLEARNSEPIRVATRWLRNAGALCR